MLFGVETNVLTLAHLCFLEVLMVVLIAVHFKRFKIKTGLFFIYMMVFAILAINMTNLFAVTFSIRVLFSITAGLFLYVWNSSTSEQEMIQFLKAMLYTIGIAALFVYAINPLEGEARLSGLFDVHTTKYFFFTFIIVFTHQVLKYNRRTDYIALSFAFILVGLSLQRGLLLTTLVFLLLAFRGRVLGKIPWVVLVLLICFQIGLFDAVMNRLFYKPYDSEGSVGDLLSNINSSGRLEFWTYLWKNEEISFLGNGLGYSIEIGKKLFYGLNLVHNDFLWILIDAGILGLLGLSIIFIFMYKRVAVQQDKTLRKVYLALIISLPIVMFVDNVVFHLYVYFPLLFAYFNLQVKSLNNNE